jgi:hypothetical protein
MLLMGLWGALHPPLEPSVMTQGCFRYRILDVAGTLEVEEVRGVDPIADLLGDFNPRYRGCRQLVREMREEARANRTRHRADEPGR